METPFGTLEAWSTPDHVGFSEPTGERGQTVYDVDGRKVATMVFNGIPHYVRIDLRPEGTQGAGRWGSHGWSTDWHYSVKRADRILSDHASDSVNRKVQEVLIPFLCEWLATTPEGRKLLTDGTATRQVQDIESAKATVETKQRELAEAEARLADLLAQVVPVDRLVS